MMMSLLHWQVVQLTGFSDPVYAEAYVNVNQYDIVLDVLIVNQTPDTLQGLTLELATLGMELSVCTRYLVEDTGFVCGVCVYTNVHVGGGGGGGAK